jgi:hypothetical protein
MKFEGTATVQVTVDGSGAVSMVIPVGGIPELRESTIKAVRQWRWEPQAFHGAPAKFTIDVSMKYHDGCCIEVSLENFGGLATDEDLKKEIARVHRSYFTDRERQALAALAEIIKWEKTFVAATENGFSCEPRMPIRRDYYFRIAIVNCAADRYELTATPLIPGEWALCRNEKERGAYAENGDPEACLVRLREYTARCEQDPHRPECGTAASGIR